MARKSKSRWHNVEFNEYQSRRAKRRKQNPEAPLRWTGGSGQLGSESTHVGRRTAQRDPVDAGQHSGKRPMRWREAPTKKPHS